MRVLPFATTLIAVSLSGCNTTKTTGASEVEAVNQSGGGTINPHCDEVGKEAASHFLLQFKKKQAYNQAYADCMNQGGGDGSNELVLVKARTQKAADSAANHLQSLPAEIVAQARCIAEVAKDDIGWGLQGASIGAGLVSCRTQEGWSSPSYLSLGGFTLGPSIGFLNDDTTFLYTDADASKVFGTQFTIDASVYAIAGSAEVELSIDTDGCFKRKFVNEVDRNCTLAVSTEVGLAAGANVKAVVLRHMNGLLGGGLVGRNARVYGAGTSPKQILKATGVNGPDVTQAWVSMLNQQAP